MRAALLLTLTPPPAPPDVAARAKITSSSGNVFADLGLPDADRLLGEARRLMELPEEALRMKATPGAEIALEHAGVRGAARFSPHDGCYVGHLADVPEISGFHGDTLKELRAAFVRAAEDHVVGHAASLPLGR